MPRLVWKVLQLSFYSKHLLSKQKIIINDDLRMEPIGSWLRTFIKASLEQWCVHVRRWRVQVRVIYGLNLSFMFGQGFSSYWKFICHPTRFSATKFNFFKFFFITKILNIPCIVDWFVTTENETMPFSEWLDSNTMQKFYRLDLISDLTKIF